MATTQNTFTGDGSNLGPFSFTFKWLESTDIKVTVAGVLKTAGTHYNLQSLNYSTKTGGQVLFTAGNAPANGAAIVIYRQTDDTDLAATFYSGSAIRAQDLNNNFVQGLYVTQESSNNATTAIGTANTALTNANTAISTANGAVTTANTASSNASAAVATANTASSNASAAVSTANTASSNATTAVNTANSAASNASTALSTANTALSTANTASSNASTALSTANTASTNASAAVSTANTASSNASSAVSTANTASSNASTALSTANTAISTANAAASAVANAILYDIVANVAAIPASPANNDAVEVTDSTGIQSFTPLTGVPAGFVGSSGLSVRLVYTTTGSTWNWIQYFPNDPETRYLKLAGGTLTGDLTVANQGDIRFGEATANGSNYVAIQAPSSLAANVTYTLPSADGTSGQLLSTNGTGTLSWATASGGSSVTTSDTPPATPNDGDLWYDSVGGRTYVYYQDPNGSQWVDASPQGDGSSTSITTGNTTAEVIDTGSDGRFVVTTEGSERLRINSSGQVALGGATPVTELTMPLTFGSAGEVNKLALYGSNFGFGISTGAVNYISTENHVFYNGASAPKVERARIDSSGRLLVGTSSSSLTAKFVVQARTDDSTGNGAVVVQRGSIPSAANQTLGAVQFTDSSGNYGAWILGESDGGGWTSGSNHRSRLVFSTTADGASSPTERMRIHENGGLSIGTTSKGASVTDSLGIQLGTSGVVGFGQFIRDGGALLQLNRRTNDGDLVIFYQDNVQEGSISVSGTTVSYNGAHLSRWSQLPSGAERTEILRGSVLSNIDEMCEWGDEDNEQLNRMKVSDIEGDKNVSGVFQAWDDDDDTYTNDFYCAMTGDFIIRIGAGVAVERGDLLMSAGDGTAKPQDDDIIRSKTIAKVTSTNVTCTYDDGSYCVSCVLMAC